jgi:hypothetical protein
MVSLQTQYIVEAAFKLLLMNEQDSSNLYSSQPLTIAQSLELPKKYHNYIFYVGESLDSGALHMQTMQTSKVNRCNAPILGFSCLRKSYSGYYQKFDANYTSKDVYYFF